MPFCCPFAGTPFELLSDNSTNFVGGEWDFCEAFDTMAPQLQEELAKWSISFRLKTTLQVIHRDKSVPEPVLKTVLIKVESIEC